MSRPAAAAPRCAQHPQALAGWRCQDCARLLCPDCVAAEFTAGTSYEFCAECDGRVAPVTVPGSRESYAELFLHSLRVPVGWVTLAVLVGVWVLVYLAWRLPTLGTGLLFAGSLTLLWGVFFAVLRAAADGLDRVGMTASAELGAQILRPAGGMAAISWLAVLGVWLLTRQAGLSSLPDEDPRAWALVLIAALLIPTWTLSLARGDGVMRALSPVTSLRIAGALGRDYLGLAALSGVTSGLVFFWLGAGAYMKQEGVGPFALLMNVFALYGVLLFGRLCGLVLAARADALGIPFREDQRILALPDAAPRGTRKAKAPPPPSRPRLEFVELDTAAPEGPMSVTGFTEVDPLDHALGTFAVQSDGEAAALPTGQLVEIGQRAAARGRMAEAVRALKLAASSRPDDPEAARACVILARLYSERLGDEGSAEKLYRYVVQRYPSTSAASFAASKLPDRV